jgi:hypothetical protein
VESRGEIAVRLGANCCKVQVVVARRGGVRNGVGWYFRVAPGVNCIELPEEKAFASCCGVNLAGGDEGGVGEGFARGWRRIGGARGGAENLERVGGEAAEAGEDE